MKKTFTGARPALLKFLDGLWKACSDLSWNALSGLAPHLLPQIAYLRWLRVRDSLLTAFSLHEPHIPSTKQGHTHTNPTPQYYPLPCLQSMGFQLRQHRNLANEPHRSKTAVGHCSPLWSVLCPTKTEPNTLGSTTQHAGRQSSERAFLLNVDNYRHKVWESGLLLSYPLIPLNIYISSDINVYYLFTFSYWLNCLFTCLFTLKRKEMFVSNKRVTCHSHIAFILTWTHIIVTQLCNKVIPTQFNSQTSKNLRALNLFKDSIQVWLLYAAVRGGWFIYGYYGCPPCPASHGCNSILKCRWLRSCFSCAYSSSGAVMR